MGGSVGLKGTDGMVEEAIRRGARDVAHKRSKMFLQHIKKNFEFYTCFQPMGKGVTDECGIDANVVYTPSIPTTAEDTKKAVGMMENVDLIVFVGGDGTARDIMEVVGTDIPVMGVPSGVKMYSAVFAQTPYHAAEIVNDFAEGISIEEREDIDINEDAFRKGKLLTSVKGYCLTPVHEKIQPSKDFFSGNEESKKIVVSYIAEKMDDETVYIIGSGSTTWQLKKLMGIEGTLLGVDIVKKKRLLCGDASESDIEKLIGRKNKIIISPLGGHGFIFGRGNEQISPEVIKKVGKENIIVISTKEKLSHIKSLKVDTGDVALDEELRGYMKVITGYGESKLMKVE